ncbi:MAG: MFS transporter [Acidobacteriota bacterium]|nr:MFS transporter [Acidobacteriota bacterium]
MLLSVGVLRRRDADPETAVVTLTLADELDTAPSRWLGSGVWLACLLLFGAMFNLTLVVAGLKEFIIDDLAGTVTDATLFFSIETIAYILFAPIWGLLSDRLGRRRPFIIIGFALSSLIYFAYGAVQSVSVLLVLRFAQGACSVMGWSLVMAAIVDRVSTSRQGRVMGLMGGSLILGVAIGAPVGGYLTRWLGSRAPLTSAGMLFALLALAAFFLSESKTLRSGIRVQEMITALNAEARLLLPLAFHFVDRLAVGLFVVVFPLYLDSLGASDPAVRGRYLSYFLLPFAFLQYVSGRVSERTGPWPPLLIGSFAYGVLLCFVGYADLLLLAPIMVGLGVLASVMFPPAILLVAELSDSRVRGSAMGGFNLAGSLGFALGPLLGGWAYGSRGFAFAFVVCGVAEVVAVLAALVALRVWGPR